jgi:hypothetical protein
MTSIRRPFIAAAFGLTALLTQAGAQITFNSPAFVTAGQLDTIYGAGESSPIGFTYAGDKFVGTGGYYFTSGQLYQTNLTGGGITTFGSPIPDPGGEVVLSASPSAGGFGNNSIYVGSGSGGNIYEYSNSGGTPTLFTTLALGAVRGISFDTQGLYGDKMIVTTTAGAIYEVDSTGHSTLLADLGTDTEGIGFATGLFGTFAKGTLFTASENTDRVNAISPLGVVTPVFEIPDAESISFVPADIATETDPIEGFYGVDYPQDILFAPASQFDQYAGDVIVTSEINGANPNIYAISLDGMDNATITGIGHMIQPEDSIFVTEATVVNHGVPDGGSTALLILVGLVPLAAWSRRARLSRAG